MNSAEPFQLGPEFDTTVTSSQLLSTYNQYGYCVIRNFFSIAEIELLKAVILNFHQRWQKDNAEFYRDVAFNSSLITGSKYLSNAERLTLFNFISAAKMMSAVNTLLPNYPSFMNTQLFFNPINPELNDFWHRDCQYDHDLLGQQKAIAETQVVHLRVPLFDEPGMELIPGTHQRWDTKQELEVREEIGGRLANDPLPHSHTIPLNAGDLLIFSADMIHRGLYGLDRLAWDILVFDGSPMYIDYIDPDCLPNDSMLKHLADPSLFVNARRLISLTE